MADDKFSFWTISQKAFAGLFSYCIHTSLGGVDVPFEGYDLLTIFLPLILRRLLTLNDRGWLVYCRKAFAELFPYRTYTSLRGV